MNTEIKFEFYEFRKKFNKLFKLSLNGKFKGVFTLLKMVGTRQFERFIYKVEKLLRGRGRYHLPIDLKHRFTFAGNTITLYSF